MTTVTLTLLNAAAHGGAAPGGLPPVPMDLWRKDHWSLLTYVETVMVEHQGRFQVGWDPRLRQGARHYDVMWAHCPRPLRAKPDSSEASGAVRGLVMNPEHGTRINGSVTLSGHDDWDCLRDFAAAGLLEDEGGQAVTERAVEPEAILRLSPHGRRLVDALRAHKASRGGTFSTFRPAPDLVAEASPPG